MPEEKSLLLHLQVESPNFDGIPPAVAKAAKDIAHTQQLVSASAVGGAGYIYRITQQGGEPQAQIWDCLVDALRQISEADSLQKAKQLARIALALSHT